MWAMVSTLQEAQHAISRSMDQLLQDERVDVLALTELGMSAGALAGQADTLYLLLIEREVTGEATEAARGLSVFFRQTDQRIFSLLDMERN